MDKKIKEEFVGVIMASLNETLKNNPGIEKYLDWFTVLAQENIEKEKVEEVKEPVLA